MNPYTRGPHWVFQLTVIFLFLFISSGFAAESVQPRTGHYFIGVEYGYHDIDMDTEFTRWSGSTVTENSTFQNNYTSHSGSLFAGYFHPWKNFYVSGQATVGIYNDEFELSVGSSRITNVLNHDISLDLMPGVYLTDHHKLSAFAKIGLGFGDFDFVKSSPTSTTYDQSENLFGYTLGVGLAYDFTPRITLKAGFEKTWYDDTRIMATLGTRTDKTVVEPELETFFFSIQYAFPK